MTPAAVAGNVPGTEDVRPGIAQNSAADSLARAAAYEHRPILPMLPMRVQGFAREHASGVREGGG